jgi:hypothetical protein
LFIPRIPQILSPQHIAVAQPIKITRHIKDKKEAQLTAGVLEETV